jgi:hypothetical protein
MDLILIQDTFLYNMEQHFGSRVKSIFNFRFDREK